MIAILEAKRAGLLTKEHLARNLLSGVVVGIVALPLGMAFAIASGAKPEQGLYTAIIAGLCTSLFGGSRLQIAGPTGAFIVILSGVSAKYGIGGLQLATLMAGIILLAMGFARLGGVIKYIPDPVITGFTSGIAIIIFVGQWKEFLGLRLSSPGEHFHQKLFALIEALPGLHQGTAAMAMFTLVVLIVSPRIFKRIPAPLIALIIATALQAAFHFEGIATIGSAFGGIPQRLPQFQVPSFTASDFIMLIGSAFTIAMLGAIESLLSAVVADGMAGTKHNSNQELIGQGIANIFSPLFGGFASTGAIARTATNIRNGATSPVSGLIHALTLILIIILLAPLASGIPLCALSAILFVVAYNMSEAHHFVRLVRIAPRADVAVLFITFSLTVFSDLVIAVNIGVILAMLLFTKRMAEAVNIEKEIPEMVGEAPINGKNLRLPPRTVVYSIDGPFFFGAAERLQSTLEHIQNHADTLVLRMGNVPFMDVTGLLTLEEIIEDCHRNKTNLVLAELRPNVGKKLARGGILKKLGARNVVSSMDDFMAFPPSPIADTSGRAAESREIKKS